MGLHFIGSGPTGQTFDVVYVCGDPHHGHPQCLTNYIEEHISPVWARECAARDEWPDDGMVYTIGYTPNDSDVSEHVYCGACGDLVSHGDGTDAIDRADDRFCTANGCTWPEYEGESDARIAARRARMMLDTLNEG